MSLSRSFSHERDLSKKKSGKFPVFHLPHDDDDDSVDDHRPPTAPVPFPLSTSPPSPPSDPPTPPLQLPRGASSPILLSNGKPLKPSLKSSSSSPTMTIPPQAQHMHLRARSEPSSPVIAHKNVHFPEKDYALATVRVFNRSARPAALSSPANGNGDETETEGEDTPPLRFPFPPVFNYEIDPVKSSPIPSQLSPLANLLVESHHMSKSSSTLTGTILVRNLAFEKQVAIRFTLDDWQTVSEVSAKYLESISLLPPQILPLPPAPVSGETNPQGWDRFTFAIRLEDYAHSLSSRIVWLAARYRTHSTYPVPGSTQYGPGGEWWDNNGGRNYRVSFRPVITPPSIPRSRPRRETVSGTVVSPSSRPKPILIPDHALGLISPSVPTSKEIHPADDAAHRSTPLRAGKLDLCNYVPPRARATSSTWIASGELPSSTAIRSSSDEDSGSPASSTLSTPSASPTIAPRVMIHGQPATFAPPHGSCQREDGFEPGHVADWDWSAHHHPRAESGRADVVSVSELPERRGDGPSPPGRGAAGDSNSVYDAFVTQWCFAQGPSSAHGYDHGGIMA